MLAWVFIIITILLIYCFFCIDTLKNNIQSNLKKKLIKFLEKVELNVKFLDNSYVFKKRGR